MNYKITSLLAASCAIGLGTAQAQVSSITYDQNSVSGNSYYGGASVSNDEADNYFFRNRYTAADARWHPGYDPDEVRVGPFVMNPVLEVGLSTTDNLFLTETNETSDTYLSVLGQVSARTTASRHMFGFDAIANNETFFDTGSEDATQYGVRGFGQLDIGSSFALAGSFAYQDAREGRSEIGGNVDAAERIAFEKTGAEVNGAYEFNRIRLRVRGSTTSYDYQDLELNSGTTVNLDGRDFDETRLAASAEYAVGRDWAVLGEIEQVNREFDIIPIGGINRDIDGIVYRVGTNFELQNNLRGEITAGYLEFEPDDPAQPTQDGLALNANVQWFPTELTTLSARAGRDVADAGGVNASSVLVTQYGLGISHELMRNIVLFGDVAFEQREFDAIGLSREDDQTDLNAGATWKVNRNIHVVGGLGFTTRDSDFEPFDETRATVTLRLFP
jgi:hypothetical protein